MEPDQPRSGLVGNSLGTDLHDPIDRDKFQRRQGRYRRTQRPADPSPGAAGRRFRKSLECTDAVSKLRVGFAGGSQSALRFPFDRDYKPKPAYEAVLKELTLGRKPAQ